MLDRLWTVLPLVVRSIELCQHAQYSTNKLQGKPFQSAYSLVDST